MKKFFRLAFVASVVWLFSAADSYAQRGPGGGQGGSANSGPSINRGPGTTQGPGNAAERRQDHVDHRGDRVDHSGRSVDQRNMSVANRIGQNPELSERLQSLLPAGASLSDAASDFKNQGQFIAAIHVSNNLNIPFDQLKLRMTGSASSATSAVSSTEAMSLGKAIRELRPDLTEAAAMSEAKKAEREAKLTEEEVRRAAREKNKAKTAS